MQVSRITNPVRSEATGRMHNEKVKVKKAALKHDDLIDELTGEVYEQLINGERARIRPNQLDKLSLRQSYDGRLERAEELKLTREREVIADPEKRFNHNLHKDVKDQLRELVLLSLERDFPEKVPRSKHEKKRRAKRERSKEAKLRTEAAMKCLLGGKSKEAAKVKEPTDKKVSSLVPEETVKREDNEKVKCEEEEKIVYSPPLSEECEDEELSTDSLPIAKGNTFTTEIMSITHSISAKKDMTKGKENAFYPLSLEVKNLLAGTEETPGPLNGLFAASHEAEVLKNLTRILEKQITTDEAHCLYEDEIIYLLQGIWSRKNQLDEFIKENESKKWGEIILTLEKWRADNKPRQLTSTYSETNNKITKRTTSHKEGTEEKPKEAVAMAEESYQAVVDNYWMSLFFASLMKVSQDKVKERSGEITTSVKSRNLRGFEAKATTYTETDEHVLNKNNKRPFIDKLLKFIEEVLRFKETGETLYESMKSIRTLEKEDKEITNVLDEYMIALKAELQRLNTKYKRIKARGIEVVGDDENEIVGELTKVIKDETVPPYNRADLEFTSRYLPDGTNDEREKAVELKNLAKMAAVTQKLIIEKFLENAENRMNYAPYCVTNWSSWATSGKEVSAGINEIYKRLETQLEVLKTS